MIAAFITGEVGGPFINKFVGIHSNLVATTNGARQAGFCIQIKTEL
jgi:LytS/YehU family sensor histidine kinase